MRVRPHISPTLTRPWRHRACAAFSLLELSVVIVIISVVAVMGLEGTAMYFDRVAYQVTQERISVVDDAIARYYRQFGTLPCPASQSLVQTDSCYGKGYRVNGGDQCASYASACSANTTSGFRHGDVPVRDLNLPLHYMVDGYGNRLRYAATSTMITSPASFASATPAIEIRSGKQDATCGGAGNRCQKRADAAYVVLSLGKGERGARPADSINIKACLPTPTADYDGRIDTVNCRFGNATTLEYSVPLNVFYDSRYNVGDVEENYFDDVIRWRARKDL